MPIRFGVFPIERVGSARGPEYIPWRFDANPAESVAVANWSMKDYGLIDRAVLAIDANAAQFTDLNGRAGVILFPQNLDTQPTTQQRTNVQTALESQNIPAGWIGAGDTWRTILRGITGIFLSMQRVTGITGSTPDDWGVTLNTTFDALPADVQSAFLQAAQELGVNTIPSSTTLRAILRGMADRWEERPIEFGFVTL
jgi:hypothetical protein